MKAQKDNQAYSFALQIVCFKVSNQSFAVFRRQRMGIALRASNGQVVKDRRRIIADVLYGSQVAVERAGRGQDALHGPRRISRPGFTNRRLARLGQLAGKFCHVLRLRRMRGEFDAVEILF